MCCSPPIIFKGCHKISDLDLRRLLMYPGVAQTFFPLSFQQGRTEERTGEIVSAMPE